MRPRPQPQGLLQSGIRAPSTAYGLEGPEQRREVRSTEQWAWRRREGGFKVGTGEGGELDVGQEGGRRPEVTK